MAEISYGGQAVIEGVMIRSPRFISVACRLPGLDGRPSPTTPIDVHTEAIRSPFTKRPWLRKLPFVRGMVALFEMLGLGLRSLERSANLQAVALAVIAPWLMLAENPKDDPSADAGKGPDEGPLAKEVKGALNGPIMWSTIAVSFGIGFLLFVALPNWLADRLAEWLGFVDNHYAKNLTEGLFRLVFFVAYVGLIGLMRDIRRVFQYHGAEHMVVNGWEAGRPLTVDGVQDQSVIHPRCGTNFAFLTIVLSIVIFTLLPWHDSIFPRIGLRLLCLPLVAGIGFELIRLVGAYREVRWLQGLILPGLALQKLTTRPPEPDMLEVALASFTAVKQAEEGGDLTCQVFPCEPAPDPGLLGELV